MTDSAAPRRDKPWMFRTYAGHSTARESNLLYRSNLAKGQTGLSIAFDLPTQTGYDSDHPLSRGEVGKVGVPVSHLGDMSTLFDGIPLGRDEYVDDDQRHRRLADGALYRGRRRTGRRRARSCRARRKTTSSRNIFRAAPMCFRRRPSLRLTQDLILFTTKEAPKFNPMNVCSYHLQEAGATPVAGARLCAGDGRRDARQRQEVRRTLGGGFRLRSSDAFPSSSTPACASSRNSARCAPSPSFGTKSPASATASKDEKLRRFRYGVQVNSLGLTEQQPENNVYRILIEMLAVVLSKNARARAVQLPGLERGARPAAALRSAMVAAHAADHGL